MKTNETLQGETLRTRKVSPCEEDGGKVTIQELRVNVKLWLKIVERLEKSAVIPVAVLQRCLPRVKKVLCQARLNLLNSDLLARSQGFLSATENIVLSVWPKLEMLIAWNNGSLFERINRELSRFTACPFCVSQIEVALGWQLGRINDGYFISDHPCQCLTGGNSFDQRQERFGLFRVNDWIFLGGLFACDAREPVIAVIAFYDHSLNEEAKTAFGWRMATVIKPENYLPPTCNLVWQKMDNLPTIEAVCLGKIIDEMTWIDLPELWQALVEGVVLDDQIITNLTNRTKRFREYLN